MFFMAVKKEYKIIIKMAIIVGRESNRDIM